jgi:5-methylcytosine-specific restriction endonuclease McrA
MNALSYSDAKASGAKFYFTGKPCKRGHITKRDVSTRCCDECRKIVGREWVNNNRDKMRAADRKWRQSHPDKVKAKGHRWYWSNPKKHTLDAIRWNRAHPERRVESSRKWQKNHPENRRAHHVLRRSRKRSAEGKFTAADIKRLLKLQRNRCAFYANCRTRFVRTDFHIDHIMPLAKGGSNWPNNIQLLCADCNIKKNAADPIDFARRYGRML